MDQTIWPGRISLLSIERNLVAHASRDAYLVRRKLLSRSGPQFAITKPVNKLYCARLLTKGLPENASIRKAAFPAICANS